MMMLWRPPHSAHPASLIAVLPEPLIWEFWKTLLFETLLTLPPLAASVCRALAAPLFYRAPIARVWSMSCVTHRCHQMARRGKQAWLVFTCFVTPAIILTIICHHCSNNKIDQDDTTIEITKLSITMNTTDKNI